MSQDQAQTEDFQQRFTVDQTDFNIGISKPTPQRAPLAQLNRHHGRTTPPHGPQQHILGGVDGECR